MKLFHMTLAILIMILSVSCSHETTKPVVAPKDRNVASVETFINPESMAAINLSNIVIMDSEGNNSMPYRLQPGTVTDEMLGKLLQETGDDLVISRIFTASTRKGSNIKKVYGFITMAIVQEVDVPESKTFNLNIITENKKGNFSLVDYEIKEVAQREMTVVNGPSDDEIKYKVKNDTSLLPY